MESAAFIIFALLLKRDRRIAALSFFVVNMFHYFVIGREHGPFVYYATAALLDGITAWFVVGLNTRTSFLLAVFSLISCIINGLGYLWYLAYMSATPYNIAITMILVIQMAILLRAGIYDTGRAFCNFDDRVGMRDRVLGTFKGKMV
jgi:hypothetical protein